MQRQSFDDCSGYCSTCEQLREEIASMQQEMRDMQRDHDYQCRELENEIRMAEREAHDGYR